MIDPSSFFGILPLETVLVIALFLLLFVVVAFVIIYRRLLSADQLYRRLYQGADGTDLEALFRAIDARLRLTDEGLTELRAARQNLSDHLAYCYQGLGLVRFNAFEGVGSDLSFSLALMDGRKDGVVLSSLFGRDESRVYAKPLRGGQSTYQLTSEEKEAIRLAAVDWSKKAVAADRTPNRSPAAGQAPPA
ncbi:MAG: DUF4446 family protein [Bacillota bacterium]